MTRVTALTAGRNVPSSRFRVRQYIAPLAELGVQVREHLPRIERHAMPRVLAGRRRGALVMSARAAWVGARALAAVPGCIASYRSDVTWLERQLVPSWLTLEPLLHRPLVLDVDDAIWADGRVPRLCAGLVAEVASAIMVGNDYLADWFRQYNAKIHVVPTAIDTARFHPALGERHDDEFRVVWTGLGSNLNLLYSIEDGLRRLLHEVPAAVLLVVSDERPRFASLSRDRVRFVPWSRENEATALREADVGLMPLDDSEWNRGKCSFKMLQCMATGLPVVVSPVGLNAEILALAEVGLAASSPAEYGVALHGLYRDRALGRKMGLAGRALVEQRFSVDVIAPHIARILKGVC